MKTKASTLIKILIHKIRNGSAQTAPTMILGAPGIGKSDIVRQVKAAVEDVLPGRLIDLRTVLLDAVDTRGLPHVDVDENGNKKTVWIAPGFLPTPEEAPGVIFLDELTNAPNLVQSAFLQLVLDRELGEYKLPDGWVILAAGNRVEDRAGSNKLIKSLANRFGSHVTLEVDTNDWLAWARKAEIDSRIRAFINFRPELLHRFDPKDQEPAFASPRSWAMLSDQLDSAPSELILALAQSCVGEGVGAEFFSFVQIHDELPCIDDIVADPDNAPADITAPAVLYALCGALGSRAADAKDGVACARYATRLPTEFAVLAIREIIGGAGCKAAAADEKVLAFIKKHRDLMNLARSASKS